MKSSQSRSTAGRIRPAARACGAVVAVAGLFGLPGGAAAQSDDAGRLEGTLEEIVVTATRREESLQDIAISVTALSEAQLERQGVDNFIDFANKIPTLGYNNSGGPTFQTLSIRGVGTASGGTASNGSPVTVSVYIDETPVTAPFSRNSAAQPLVFDMQQIEVSRGPQGTLFGASTMGGAIRYITNKPDTSEFSARVTGDLSTTENGDYGSAFTAMANVPLVEDRLALRAVIWRREDAGFIDRLPLSALENLPQSDTVDPFRANRALLTEDVNSTTTEGGRFQARLHATDNLTITGMVNFQDIELDTITEFRPELGEFLDAGNSDSPQSTNYEQFTLNVEYDIFDRVTLISNTSYMEREVVDSSDLSDFFASFLGVDRPTLIANTQDDMINDRVNPMELTVQEIRLQSNSDGALQWLLGFWYLEQEGGEDQNILGQSAIAYGKSIGVIPLDAPDFGFAENSVTEEEQQALFANVSYDVTDNFTVSAGLRATEVEKFENFIFDGALFGTANILREGDFDTEVTPRIEATWRLSDDKMVYATAANGFRTGRLQAPLLEGPCAADLVEIGIDPAASGVVEGDSLWSYEVGAKTSWNRNRYTVNLAAYTIDWSDIQQTINLDCGSGFVTNAGDVEVRGFEIETVASPTDSVQLNFSVGFADAEVASLGQFDVPGLTDGATVPEIPKWTVNTGGQYRFPIRGDMSGYLRADVSYRSEVFEDFDESPELRRPDYWLGSARLGVESERWDASLYVDNLFDELIVNTIASNGAVLRPGRPRTWGVRVGYTF